MSVVKMGTPVPSTFMASSPASPRYLRSPTQNGRKFLQDSQLSQNDRPGGIAVERLDLAVCHLKDVATRSVHLLAGRRNDSHRQMQRTVVCSLQREFNDDGVSDDVERVQLTMHVRKRGRINLNGATELRRTTIGDPDRFVSEGSVFSETVHKPGDILIFGDLVRSANCYLVSRHSCSLLRDVCQSHSGKSIASADATAGGFQQQKGRSTVPQTSRCRR